MEFTKELLQELKLAYNKAVVDHVESFNFHGHLLIPAYAKYLIEYLDSQFG